jgi:hypothetical protein
MTFANKYKNKFLTNILEIDSDKNSDNTNLDQINKYNECHIYDALVQIELVENHFIQSYDTCFCLTLEDR